MTANELFRGIEGQRFKQQRKLLSAIIDVGHTPTEDDLELLEGLRNLLDCVADVAHDEYGKDTLFISVGPEGGCGHDEHEDCLICSVCSKCSESLDDDDVCSDCLQKKQEKQDA